jgi:hypothetical protein
MKVLISMINLLLLQKKGGPYTGTDIQKWGEAGQRKYCHHESSCSLRSKTGLKRIAQNIQNPPPPHTTVLPILAV